MLAALFGFIIVLFTLIYFIFKLVIHWCRLARHSWIRWRDPESEAALAPPDPPIKFSVVSRSVWRTAFRVPPQSQLDKDLQQARSRRKDRDTINNVLGPRGQSTWNDVPESTRSEGESTPQHGAHVDRESGANDMEMEERPELPRYREYAQSPPSIQVKLKDLVADGRKADKATMPPVYRHHPQTDLEIRLPEPTHGHRQDGPPQYSQTEEMLPGSQV